MRKMMLRFTNAFFDHNLDLRVRLFNVLVLVSACFCVIIAIVNAFAGIGFVGVLVDLVAAVFCLALLFYARRSEKTRISHMIFIIGSFFVLFPYLFFSMGGYYGGITVFLVFAVVFTVFMLEGKTALVVTTLELALYTGLYIYGFKNPDSVKMFPEEKGFFISNLMDLLIVGIALGATMYAQTSLYRKQQQKLDEQNAVLAEANRSKTEFLANISHEMRTPLTVISVNVQSVADILQYMDESASDSEAVELLVDAQEEIMRLARMVGGMLSLSSIKESSERSKVDLAELLRGSGDIMRLLLTKRKNSLQIDADENLMLFGDADLLSQVIINLIQNAHNHTENDVIGINAKRDESMIIVTVKDNGSGIDLELLPHVFERGVSDGGNGYGLFLCRMVVEAHGGTIHIESELGKGTTVNLSLPVYQGQYGGDRS